MVRIDFSRLRFLVVDDNPHMRRTVRTILNGLGVREVCEADDGASAVESFTRYMPDIIIADWVMPMFSGIEITRMIRQQSANANPYVPIIMLTAHSQRWRVVEARDAGMSFSSSRSPPKRCTNAFSMSSRIRDLLSRPRPFSVPIGTATSILTMTDRNAAAVARRRSSNRPR